MRMKILAKDGDKIIDMNRRRAIREKCLNCSAWSCAEVRLCSFTDCKLHPFRSGQGKQNAKMRNKAIRQFCLRCMKGQRSEVTKCPSKNCSLFPYRKTGTDWSVELKFNGKK